MLFFKNYLVVLCCFWYKKRICDTANPFSWLFFDKFVKLAEEFLIQDEEFRKSIDVVITEKYGEFKLKNYLFYC